MKIALLIDSLGFGGAQRQMANLAVELKNAGNDVLFIRYRNDDFYLPLLQRADIQPVLVSGSNFLSRVLQIRKKLHQYQPEILISFMDASNFYAALASSGKHSWKLIICERISNPSRFTSRQGKILKWVMENRADAICCNSKSAEALWRKYYPRSAGKLCTIYNIVDVPQVEAEAGSDGKTRFLVAARYEKEKNLLGMIEAVNALSQEDRQNMELHWFGKANVGAAGPLEIANEKIQQYGLENCIFLHPATDRIHEEMAKADFVSLFSFMEGLPNAILEGMSLKKPIVMSKVSDYAVLVDESNGFCCDPKSTEDIAAAIRKAIHTTPEQRQAMGQRSYEKIQKVCSRQAVIAQWSELMENIRNKCVLT